MHKGKKVMVDVNGSDFIDKVIEASLTHKTVKDIFKAVIGSVSVVLPDYKIYRLFLNVHMTLTQCNNLKMILESSCGEDIKWNECNSYWCVYGGQRTVRYFKKINDWRTDNFNEPLYRMQRNDPDAFKLHVDNMLSGANMFINCADEKKIHRHVSEYFGFTLIQYIMIVHEDEELILQCVRHAADNGMNRYEMLQLVAKTKFRRIGNDVHRYCAENGIR